MMKKTFSLVALLALMLAGCDNIAQDERLIYVEPVQQPATDPDSVVDKKVVPLRVLLEDFTGQRCTNCPRGTEVIEQLQEYYGDSAVIAVGIHGGPLAFKGNAKTLGLATDIGDEYYDYWKLEYQPVGLVNRHGALNYMDWTAAVGQELAKQARLELTATATVGGGQVNIGITATGVDGQTDGKLQVWLLEDGIQAMQLMPDGSANADYVHNHVLRTPVNGTWGQDFTLSEGQTVELTMAQPLDPAWNPARLSVVAFVASAADGVLQVTKAAVQ